MRRIETDLEGVFLIEPDVFQDDRGYLFESYNQIEAAKLGIQHHFVQDSQSYSQKNVIRGLHYQIRKTQGKLIRVLYGTILDVIVDLRKPSPTYHHARSFTLSDETRQVLWVPPGFAHGFRVMSEGAHVLYKEPNIRAKEQ